MWIASLDSKGKAARRRPRQKTASPQTSVFIAQPFKAVHNSSPTVLETSDGQKGDGNSSVESRRCLATADLLQTIRNMHL